MNKHIASYLSPRGDYEVIVTLLTDACRYAVRIYDIDAEDTLHAVAYFTDAEIAKAYALKCAASDMADEELPL